jgi:hypothetical protein
MFVFLYFCIYENDFKVDFGWTMHSYLSYVILQVHESIPHTILCVYIHSYLSIYSSMYPGGGSREAGSVVSTLLYSHILSPSSAGGQDREYLSLQMKVLAAELLLI